MSARAYGVQVEIQHAGASLPGTGISAYMDLSSVDLPLRHLTDKVYEFARFERKIHVFQHHKLVAEQLHVGIIYYTHSSVVCCFGMQS